MITCVIAMMPPAPMPCRARKPMSTSIDCESPASIELSAKTVIAVCISSFLLTRSDSLPQMGVDAVVVSSVAVTTQV